MFRTSSDESSIALTSTTKLTNTLASVNEYVATTRAKVGVSDLLRGNTSELLTPCRYFVHRCERCGSTVTVAVAVRGYIGVCKRSSVKGRSSMTMQSNQNPDSGYFHSVGGQLLTVGIAAVALVVLSFIAFW
jgi:hypothetical protein